MSTFRRNSILFLAPILTLVISALVPATAHATPVSAGTPLASFQGRNWEGDLGTPSDQTGAIGPDRYFEYTNSGYSIYTRAGVLLGSGTAGELAHVTDADT